MNKKIKDKNLNVDFIRDEDMYECWILADKLRISQVMINLLSNAIKFSYSGDTITILINKISKGSDFNKSNQIFICISDNGRGISLTIMSHLFGRFVTDSESGTVVGSFISKNIVEARVGRI